MKDSLPTPDYLERLQDLFEQALEKEPDNREEFVRSAAGEDEQFRNEVLALLQAHQSGDGRIPQSIVTRPTVESDAWIGKQVGAYEIVRLIGVGGMGAVYEGRRADDQFSKRVAIKFLHAHANGADAVRRFKAERQILASLDHPGIAALIDGGVTSDGQPYLMMEYIDGRPLTQWCDEQRLTIRERLPLFQQVAAAVQSAHQALVVHRDLKPGNILVTTEGRVKLLDFGIARLLPQESGTDSLPSTMSTVRSFTPDYAAPEQVRGEKPGTGVDIYALGVVLFELLTGQRPFQIRDQRLSELERIICETPAPAPSSQVDESRPEKMGERSVAKIRAQIAGDIDSIVLMALRKEPSRRYGSAELMSRDVSAYLSGHPVSGRPDGLGYRMQKFVRRRKLETAAIGIATVSLVAGLIGVTIQARRAEAQRQKATQVTDFLTTMLGSANPASLGKDVTVREVLDSAALRAETLAGTPELDAEIRIVIGNTYLALGEFDAAETQFKKALAAHGKRSPAGDVQTAVAYTRQSHALENGGNFAAADSVLNLAAALFARHPAKNPLERANFLDRRASILARLGRVDEAEPLFREGLETVLEFAPGNDSLLAPSYANLGFALAEQGKLAAAESLYVKAVAVGRRAYGPVHSELAALMSPYAAVLDRMNKVDKADSVYRETLDVRRKLLGADHPEYAWTMFSYADFLLGNRQFADAAKWCREVLKLRGKTLPDSHMAVSTAMSVLGRSLDGVDSLVAGEYWLRESLRLRKENLPEGNWLILSSESILGAHMVAAGRFEEGEALLLPAERKLVEARGEDAPVVNDVRKRIVALYKAWGKPADAAKWEAKLSGS
jgi:serine/threonine protein kinase/tetratricopeptide (TPR) repeat protein